MTSDGTATYKYDAIGRVDSVGTTPLEYDLFDNMTRYGSNYYNYDAYNQRFLKSANGDTTYYLTSGPTVLHEYTEGDTTPVFEHYYDGRGLLATYEKDRGYLFYYKDHLGSTRQLSGTDMRRDYYPYGDARTAAGSDALANQFTGKELDNNIGLYYFGARYYNPEVGVWMVPDPAGQGWSPYVYCGGNPVNMIDPDGRLFGIDDFFIVMAIGAAVGGTTGGIVAHNNDVDWWKGAIAGSFIGAGIGAYMAPAVGATGIYTTAGTSVKIATDGWGIATSIINGANVNMVMGALGGADGADLWKYGLAGAASGYFTVSGGLGLAKQGRLARFAFQGIGTAGRSIGNNWARNEDPFSKVTLGVGPVNLTLGRGQQLFQTGNNLGNIITNVIGAANIPFGGKMELDMEHYTWRWGGGRLEKIYTSWSSRATGMYAMLGEHLPDGHYNIGHEAHHIWQSRSMGDAFFFNYVAQMVNALTCDEKIKDLTYKMNYYEKLAYPPGAWGY